MNSLNFSYTVTPADFREAKYYGLFVNRRTPFRAAALVLIVFFVYCVLCVSKVLTFVPAGTIPALMALAYILFGLAGTEREILSYTKSEESLLGVRYQAFFDRQHFTLEIPEKNVKAQGRIRQLYCAYELYRIFLLYTDARQVFIVPTKGLSQEENRFLRTVLRENLDKRFSGVFRR